MNYTSLPDCQNTTTYTLLFLVGPQYLAFDCIVLTDNQYFFIPVNYFPFMNIINLLYHLQGQGSSNK